MRVKEKGCMEKVERLIEPGYVVRLQGDDEKKVVEEIG